MGRIKWNRLFTGNTLSLPKKEVVLPHPILDVLKVGAVYVVMLNWSPEHLSKRNVFGISSEGDTLWRIGEPPFTLQPGDAAPYTNIGIKEGKLLGGCWVGYDVIIDPDDGSVEMIPPKGRLW